jgi:hypothetical protein
MKGSGMGWRQGWKNGNKKGLQQRIAAALSGGRYLWAIMFVLNQTLSSAHVSVFFKTNTLSEIFVHLSAERWHFFASFQNRETSISATFPCTSHQSPSPHTPPSFFSFRVHPSHTTFPSKSPTHSWISALLGGHSTPQKHPVVACLFARLEAAIWSGNTIPTPFHFPALFPIPEASYAHDVPIQIPLRLPCFLPFQGDAVKGDLQIKSMRLRQKQKVLTTNISCIEQRREPF